MTTKAFVRILFLIPLLSFTVSTPENNPVVTVLLWPAGIKQLKQPFDHTFSSLEIDHHVPKESQLEYLNPVQMSLNYLHPDGDGYLVQVKILDQILYSNKRSDSEQSSKERIIVKEATLTVSKNSSFCETDQTQIEMNGFYIIDGKDSGVNSKVETERIKQSICKLIEKNRLRMDKYIWSSGSQNGEKFAENILGKYEYRIKLEHMLKYGGDKDTLFMQFIAKISGPMNEVVTPSSDTFELDKAKRLRRDDYMASFCVPIQNFLQIIPFEKTTTVFKNASMTTKFAIETTQVISRDEEEEEEEDEKDNGGVKVNFHGPLTTEPAIEPYKPWDLRATFFFYPSCFKFEVELVRDQLMQSSGSNAAAPGIRPPIDMDMLENYFKEKVATVKFEDPYNWRHGIQFRKTRFERVGSEKVCFTMDFEL